MKTYKHKNSDLTAKYNNSMTYDIYDCENTIITKGVPSTIIHLGNDRESQPESDWIDKLFMRIPELNDEKEFRAYINNHMPKITKEEFEDCYDTKDIIYLLEKKQLYKE